MTCKDRFYLIAAELQGRGVPTSVQSSSHKPLVNGSGSSREHATEVDSYMSTMSGVHDILPEIGIGVTTGLLSKQC